MTADEAGSSGAGNPGADAARPRVLVLAADPVWAARLASQLRLLGADIECTRTIEPVAGRIASGELAGIVVDVSALGYDGIAAVGCAAAAGIPALAVIGRDDPALRRRAKAAGATWVATYRAMFQRGPRIGASWLGLPVPTVPRSPVARSKPLDSGITPPDAAPTPGEPQS